jgi:hypothetical protein
MVYSILVISGGFLMAIGPVTENEAGSSVRAKLNNIIGIANLIPDVSADIETLDGRLDAEIASRKAEVRSIGTNRWRPGLAPFNFSSLSAGGPGADDLGGESVTTARGTVRRLTGTGRVTTRERYPVGTGVQWWGVALVERAIDSGDPAGDGTRIEIVWLDANAVVITRSVVWPSAANIALSVVDGLMAIPFMFGGVALPAPPGATDATVSVATWGGDTGATDVVAVIVQPVAPAEGLIDSRVTALENTATLGIPEVLLDELRTLSSRTYSTAQDLIAATVPAFVDSVELLGYYQEGDGGGSTNTRGTSGWLTSANGVEFVNGEPVLHIRQRGIIPGLDPVEARDRLNDFIQECAERGYKGIATNSGTIRIKGPDAGSALLLYADGIYDFSGLHLLVEHITDSTNDTIRNGFVRNADWNVPFGGEFTNLSMERDFTNDTGTDPASWGAHWSGNVFHLKCADGAKIIGNTAINYANSQPNPNKGGRFFQGGTYPIVPLTGVGITDADPDIRFAVGKLLVDTDSDMRIELYGAADGTLPLRGRLYDIKKPIAGRPYWTAKMRRPDGTPVIPGATLENVSGWMETRGTGVVIAGNTFKTIPNSDEIIAKGSAGIRITMGAADIYDNAGLSGDDSVIQAAPFDAENVSVMGVRVHANRLLHAQWGRGILVNTGPKQQRLAGDPMGWAPWHDTRDVTIEHTMYVNAGGQAAKIYHDGWGDSIPVAGQYDIGLMKNIRLHSLGIWSGAVGLADFGDGEGSRGRNSHALHISGTDGGRVEDVSIEFVNIHEPLYQALQVVGDVGSVKVFGGTWDAARRTADITDDDLYIPTVHLKKTNARLVLNGTTIKAPSTAPAIWVQQLSPDGGVPAIDIVGGSSITGISSGQSGIFINNNCHIKASGVHFQGAAGGFAFGVDQMPADSTLIIGGDNSYEGVAKITGNSKTIKVTDLSLNSSRLEIDPGGTDMWFPPIDAGIVIINRRSNWIQLGFDIALGINYTISGTLFSDVWDTPGKINFRFEINDGIRFQNLDTDTRVIELKIILETR